VGGDRAVVRCLTSQVDESVTDSAQTALPLRAAWLAEGHPHDVTVEQDVDSEGQAAQPDLDWSRQVRRIEQWQDVVLDELTLLDGRPATLTKVVLERRQRTDPSAELDEDAPSGGRHVNPGEPRPARHQETTQDDEDDERRMHRDHEVGCRTKDGWQINWQRRHFTAVFGMREANPIRTDRESSW
jgi:hypothetical protein